MRRVGLACVLAMASTAWADPTADQLRAQGEAQAKRGEFAEAIKSFKAADEVAPQAIYACMIGLTYMRRNLLAQAELFMGRCHTRARNEALPAWVASADKQLAQAIADGKLTKFVLKALPVTAGATFRVSGFEDKEIFDLQPIHLPAGRHTIIVSAPSYPEVVKEVEATGTGDEQLVEFVLEQPRVDRPVPVATPPTIDKTTEEPVASRPLSPPPPPVAVERRESKLPLALMISGGVLAVGGGVMHVVTYKKGQYLGDAPTRDEYNRRDNGTFEKERIATFGLYGAAAAAFGIGLYLHLRHPESAASVSAAPVPGGGVLAIGWQR